MNRTQRFEEQEVLDALERERHEPTHRVIGKIVIERTAVAQAEYDGVVGA